MRRAVVPLLTLCVAVVLADSAVVTLALPDILDRLGGTVARVAWVLIAFNLVLAIVVVPAAWLCASRGSRLLCAAGIVVFAGGSAFCALAGSIPVLIGARCVQALGGAFVLVGCLELLVAATGHRRGVSLWVAAGVVGTAVGPCAGGILTEAFGWQAIFVVQVPIAVVAVPAALAVRGDRSAFARSAPPSGCAQCGSGVAGRRADRGAAAAGPAPRRRLAPLTRYRCADRLGRAAGGVARPATGSRSADHAAGGDGERMLPGRWRAGRSGSPALRRPGLDDRPPGTDRARTSG